MCLEVVSHPKYEWNTNTVPLIHKSKPYPTTACSLVRRRFHCTALEGCPQATFGRPLERRSLLGSAGSVLIMDDGGREELQLPTIQSYLPLHKSPQAPGLGKLLSKGTVGLGQEAERLTAALGVD